MYAHNPECPVGINVVGWVFLPLVGSVTVYRVSNEQRVNLLHGMFKLLVMDEVTQNYLL